VEAHGGRLAVEVLRRYGVDTMFTLSGGHLFVLYDGAVQSDDMRLVDARHEQTVVFAAEGWAKVTRRIGCAAITAGRLTAYDDANVQWQTAVATLVVSVVMLVVGFIVVRLFGSIRTALKGDPTTVVPSHGNATVR